MGMIDHVSHRIDNVVRRRNDTIHRLWFIGWGNEETETYEVAGSMKAVRNIGKNSLGGVRYTDRSTEDFDEIIGEIEKLTAIVRRFLGCVVIDRNRGKPTANFHYDSSGKLVDAPPPAKK